MAATVTIHQQAARQRSSRFSVGRWPRRLHSFGKGGVLLLGFAQSMATLPYSPYSSGPQAVRERASFMLAGSRGGFFSAPLVVPSACVCRPSYRSPCFRLLLMVRCFLSWVRLGFAFVARSGFFWRPPSAMGWASGILRSLRSSSCWFAFWVLRFVCHVRLLQVPALQVTTHKLITNFHGVNKFVSRRRFFLLFSRKNRRENDGNPTEQGRHATNPLA